jgi:hypothetical protein
MVAGGKREKGLTHAESRAKIPGMPTPAGSTARDRGVRSGEEELRKLVDWLRSDVFAEKGSTFVIAALEQELRDRKLSVRALGQLCPRVGETTIGGWRRGKSSPTFEVVKDLVAALYPDSNPVDRVNKWLREGEAYLSELDQKLEALELERRQAAVKAAVGAELDGRAIAQAVLEYVDGLEPQVREKIVRGLAGRFAKLRLEDLVNPAKEEKDG